jgi:hypothetical protein
MPTAAHTVAHLWHIVWYASFTAFSSHLLLEQRVGHKQGSRDAGWATRLRDGVVPERNSQAQPRAGTHHFRAAFSGLYLRYLEKSSIH